VSNYTMKQIVRLLVSLNKVGEDMQILGVGLVSGNCNDNAFLVDEKTGEVLGHVSPHGVWKGGDPRTGEHKGKVYCRDFSPEAEAHWKKLNEMP